MEEMIFDYNEIIETFGMEELAVSTLAMYEKMTFQDNIFATLVDPYRKKDYKTLERHAHSIKGGARNIYANHYIEICNNLQKSAEEHNEQGIKEWYISVIEYSSKIHEAVIQKLIEVHEEKEQYQNAEVWKPTGEVLKLLEEFKRDISSGNAGEVHQEVVEKEELPFSFEVASEFFGTEDTAKAMLKKLIASDLNEAKLLEVGTAIQGKNDSAVERAVGALRRSAGFIVATKLKDTISELVERMKEKDYELAGELFIQTIDAASELYNAIVKLLHPNDSSKVFIISSKLMDLMKTFVKEDGHSPDKGSVEESKQEHRNEAEEEDKEIEAAINFSSAVDTFGDEQMVLSKMNKFVNDILTASFFENMIKIYQQGDLKTLLQLTYRLKAESKPLGMDEFSRIATDMRQGINVPDASQLEDDVFKESLLQLLEIARPTSIAASRLLKKPGLVPFEVTAPIKEFLNSKPKGMQLDDNLPEVPDYDDSGTSRFNYDTALENFNDENTTTRQVMEFLVNFLGGTLLEDWADLISQKKYSALKKEASNIKRDALKLGMEAFGNICKQINMAALEEAEDAILEQFQLLVDENPKTFYKIVKQLEIRGINFKEPSDKVKQLLNKKVADDAQKAMKKTDEAVQNSNSDNQQQEEKQKFKIDPKKGFVYGKMKGGDSPPPTGLIDFSKIYNKKGGQETKKSRELKDKALSDILAKEKIAQEKSEAMKALKSEEPQQQVVASTIHQQSQQPQQQQKVEPQKPEEPKKEGFHFDPKKGIRYGKMKGGDSPPPSGVIDYKKIYEKKGSKETAASRALKQKALLQALERESANQSKKTEEKPAEQPKLNLLQKPEDDSKSSAISNSRQDSGLQSPSEKKDPKAREELKESRFKSDSNNEDGGFSFNNQQRNIRREMFKRELDAKTDKKGGKGNEREDSSAGMDLRRKKTMDEESMKKVGERSEKRNMTFSPPPNKATLNNAARKEETKEFEIKLKKEADTSTPAFGNSIVKGPSQAVEEQKTIVTNKDLKVIKEETVDKANQWRFTKLVHRERKPGADIESRIKIIKKEDGPGLYYQGWATQKKPKGDYPFDNGLKCNIF